MKENEVPQDQNGFLNIVQSAKAVLNGQLHMLADPLLSWIWTLMKVMFESTAIRDKLFQDHIKWIYSVTDKCIIVSHENYFTNTNMLIEHTNIYHCLFLCEHGSVLFMTQKIMPLFIWKIFHDGGLTLHAKSCIGSQQKAGKVAKPYTSKPFDKILKIMTSEF